MTGLGQARLYGILDLGYLAPDRLEEMTRGMAAGGVDVIQLRAKSCGPGEIVDFARRVQPICREAGIPFLINDHPEIAREVAADGVHLGQEDQSPAAARELLGPGRWIGLSTHSLAQARAAASQPVDYIGFGPLFATPTKPDYQPIGLDGIAEVHRLVRLPIFCIGGVKLANLPRILAAGARRVVIVSELLQAPDVPDYIIEVQSLLRAAQGLEDQA